MNTRPGYYTEQVRNESYKEILNNESLSESQMKVLWQIVDGPKTLQELSVILGMKESSVCARLNELREDEWIITNGEKKYNPETRKNNSLWKLNPKKFEPKQLQIF